MSIATVDGSEIPNNHLLDGAKTLWIHGGDIYHINWLAQIFFPSKVLLHIWSSVLLHIWSSFYYIKVHLSFFSIEEMNSFWTNMSFFNLGDSAGQIDTAQLGASTVVCCDWIIGDLLSKISFYLFVSTSLSFLRDVWHDCFTSCKEPFVKNTYDIPFLKLT